MAPLRFVAVTVLAAVLQPASGGEPFEPDASTVLLLHLDGDTVDSSRGRNRVSTKGETEWAEGLFGKAVSLDGKGGIVTTPSRSLHVGNQSWTMECWIKPLKEQPQHASILTGGYGHGRQFGLRLTAGKLFYVYFSADPLHGVYVKSEAISGQLFDGKWHHVAGVLDRSRNGEVRIYFDGKDLTDQGGALPFPIVTENRRLSACVGAIAPWYVGKNGFRGLVDEVRFSNVVRPEFAAGPDAPPPPEVPETQVPDAAGLKPDDEVSITPLKLAPETTVLMVPEHSPFSSDYEAVKLLQKHLRRVYGTEKGFDRINRASEAGSRAVLAVGRTRWLAGEDTEGLGKHGFLVRRKGRVILITGGTPGATLYGVAHFLDRFCGVRFYLPGDLFTSAPGRKEVVLEKVDIREEPSVKASSSSGYHSSPDAGDWQALNAVDRRVASHQHSMQQRFPPERFAEKNPEVYPILGGKRYIPKLKQDNNWQPCFSEPDLVDAAVESAESYFAGNPDLEFISFSVQDSHTFCECQRCARGVEAIGKWRSHSQLYWRFMNQVAARLEKSCPGKEVVGIAYSDVRHPPKFPLHPNVVPWLVFKISDARIDRRLDPGGEYNLLEQWARLTKRIGHHDWAHGRGFYIPRIYSSMVARVYGQAKDLGLHIKYIHAEAYPNWGLDGPKLYIMSRVWWEPSQDVNALLRQFCDDMFGEARSEMFEYFATLEALFLELNDDHERKLHRWHTQFVTDVKEREKISLARRLLDEAAKKANGDQEKKRIDLFSKSFRLSEYLFGFAAAKRIDREEIEAFKTYAREVIMPDPMTVYRSGGPEHVMEQMERILAVITRGKVE